MSRFVGYNCLKILDSRTTSVRNDSSDVNFEIAALFTSPYSRVKKRGNFKTNIHLVSVESFLYYLSSNIYPFYFIANSDQQLFLKECQFQAFSQSCYDFVHTNVKFFAEYFFFAFDLCKQD